MYPPTSDADIDAVDVKMEAIGEEEQENEEVEAPTKQQKKGGGGGGGGGDDVIGEEQLPPLGSVVPVPPAPANGGVWHPPRPEGASMTTAEV